MKTKENPDSTMVAAADSAGNSVCCNAAEQAECCEPTDKADCCGTTPEKQQPAPKSCKC